MLSSSDMTKAMSRVTSVTQGGNVSTQMKNEWTQLTFAVEMSIFIFDAYHSLKGGTIEIE